MRSKLLLVLLPIVLLLSSCATMKTIKTAVDKNCKFILSDEVCSSVTLVLDLGFAVAEDIQEWCGKSPEADGQ